jgi:hypothetical protein
MSKDSAGGIYYYRVTTPGLSTPVGGGIRAQQGLSPVSMPAEDEGLERKHQRLDPQ